MIGASVFRHPAPPTKPDVPGLGGSHPQQTNAVRGRVRRVASGEPLAPVPEPWRSPLTPQRQLADRTRQKLQVYRYVSTCYLQERWPSDTVISRLDRRAIGPIVEHLNACLSGLRLMVANSVRDLEYALRGHGPGVRQRVIFRQHPAARQYVFIDIQTRAGRPPSLLFIEPANLNTPDQIDRYRTLAQAVRNVPAYVNARLILIEALIQRNPADNLLLTLSLALGAHRHEALLSRWHDIENLGEAIGTPSCEALILRYRYLGYGLCPGESLPADFVVHAQHPEVLFGHLRTLSPGDSDARLMLQSKLTALAGHPCVPLSIARWRHQLLVHALADTPCDIAASVGAPGRPTLFRTRAAQPCRDLAIYEAIVATYLRMGWRSDALIARHDRHAIGRLVKSENARRPGLNLMLPQHLHGLAATVPAGDPDVRQRLILRPSDIEMPPHFFADIQIRAGAPPSVILIEPGSLNSREKRRMYGKFAVAVRTIPAFAKARMTIIETEVQCGAADSAMFALSHGLNAYKHATMFSCWHHAQHLEQVFGKPDDEQLAQRYARLGYQLCSGAELPADFVEHAQDPVTLLSRLLALPENDAAGRGMLQDKLLARHANDGQPLSIERWRHTLIVRALTDYPSYSSQLPMAANTRIGEK
jgi:hypothetical protein